MGKYEADLAKIVAGQQEITNAEKLLDLSVTTFPEVLSIKNDMNGLRQIYDIYKAQQVGYACKTPVHNTYKCDHLKKNIFIYIYACPVILQDAKTQWSQTLWIDLDIQLLQQGIEGFIKCLRLLPKEVRAMPVAFFLDGRMKEFRESLPLLLDLKNEALRDRSVSRLILVRNQNEYNTPPKFTVNNVVGFVLLSLRF